jgi:hypothetical protein
MLDETPTLCARGLLFLLQTVRRLSIAKQIIDTQPNNAIRAKSSAS